MNGYGILFILLSLFGVREAIINSIPATLRKAVAVGIGLFICLIGLTNAGITASKLSVKHSTGILDTSYDLTGSNTLTLV